MLTDVRDRQQLFAIHKKAKKLGLDLTKYNQLKDQMKLLELDLKRIKDPLRANQPRKSLNTTTNATTTDDLSSKETTKSTESKLKDEEIEKNLNETIVKTTTSSSSTKH